ncbi:MAG: hypothetical protein Kow00106_11280 [Anaerolineae bacterium]
MSDRRSIFFDEWQACLRAHYVYVLRTHDTVTEPTLRQVLHQTGLTDEELAALQAQALGAPLPPADPSPAAEPTPDAWPTPDSLVDDEPVEEESPPEPPPIAPGQLSLF